MKLLVLEEHYKKAKKYAYTTRLKQKLQKSRIPQLKYIVAEGYKNTIETPE